jgi:hypothetical protein
VAGSSSRIHDIVGHSATGLDRRSADAGLRRMAGLTAVLILEA